MRAGLGAVGHGTAGDDVRLGALFDDHDVVDVLPHLLGLEHQAGLDGVLDLGPGLDANEIAAVQVVVSRLGELVLVRVDQGPHVFLEAVVFLHGILDVHDLDVIVLGLTVDRRLVHLQERGGTGGQVSDHTRHEELFLVLLGQFVQIADGFLAQAVKLEILEVDFAHIGSPCGVASSCSGRIPGSRAAGCGPECPWDALRSTGGPCKGPGRGRR